MAYYTNKLLSSRQIDEILNEPDIPDSVKREFLEMPFTFYTYRANRETPEVKAESSDFRPSDLFVYVFLNLRCITIYEPADARNEREVVNGYAIESQRSF